MPRNPFGRPFVEALLRTSPAFASPRPAVRSGFAAALLRTALTITPARKARHRRENRRVRMRGAVIIGVMSGLLGVSGISAAQNNAAPGDALYGVKRSTERAQLAMAGSDLSRGQLSLGFARNRAAEAMALPPGDAALGGVLADMNADTRTGAELLTSTALSHHDIAPLEIVEMFATRQRGTLDALPLDNDVLGSVALLDEIEQRAAEARETMGCPAGESTPSCRPARAGLPGKPAADPSDAPSPYPADYPTVSSSSDDDGVGGLLGDLLGDRGTTRGP